MKVDGVVGTLCFGAAAAIALVFVEHLAAPVIGATRALQLHLVGSLAAYVALLGATPRRALRNGAAALAGAGLVMLLASGIGGLAVGLTALLALVRSGLEFSMRGVRGGVVELVLGLLALGFASWVVSPGWLGAAAALWAFALVQSLYFLVPGRGRMPLCAGPGDPFDRAREQLLALLEEV
jgi:hypothetical protein